jgi:hypothetical protein
MRWTGPQIHAQLPEISIFAATMGTAGRSILLCDPTTADGNAICRNYDWHESLFKEREALCGWSWVSNVSILGSMWTHTFISIATAPDQVVPGPRTYNLLVPLDFPWRDAVDFMEEGDANISYQRSLDLCRNGFLVGPSSGLALTGLLNFLEKRKAAGTLDELRNENGEIACK